MLGGVFGGAGKKALTASPKGAAGSIFDYEVKKGDGSMLKLESLRGTAKAFVIVNVASK